jgi:hypothetical protein
VLRTSSAIIATSVTLDCAYELLGSETPATVQYGIATGQGFIASVGKVGPCTVREKQKKCPMGGQSQSVVIGEGMNRVIPYADAFGAGYYAGLAGPGMEPFYMSDNLRWINEAMDEECRILDIGPDSRPIPSPYYLMELQQIRNRGCKWYYPVPWGR